MRFFFFIFGTLSLSFSQTGPAIEDSENTYAENAHVFHGSRPGSTYALPGHPFAEFKANRTISMRSNQKRAKAFRELYPISSPEQNENEVNSLVPLLLPDTSVHREKILIQYDGTHMNEVAFGAILRSLEPTTKVLVLTGVEPQGLRAIITRANIVDPERVFVEKSEVGSLGPWSRDYFIVKGSANGIDSVEIVRPKNIPRWTKEGEGDAPLIQRILEKLFPDQFIFSRSPLNFEGGMIINDGHTAFVSSRFFYLNPGIEEENLKQLLGKELGLQEMFVIEALPGWGHIDLYITPVGRSKVLVADTKEGAKILSLWLGTELPSRNPRAKKLTEACKNGGNAIRYRFESEGYYYFPELENLSGPLDAIASALSRQGFKVDRIPSLLGNFSSAFTYNNVFQSPNCVLVPVYGIGLADQEAHDVYHRLGFSTCQIPALEDLACQGGVLHCSIHELR